MNLITRIALLALLTILPLAVAAQSLQAQLQAELNGFAQASGGINGAVIDQNGAITTFTYGLAQIGIFEDPNIRFALSDVSQHLVAVLTLRLVEEGIIDLSDQLGPNVVPGPPSSIPTTVTIEQLLRHTSGIRSFTDVPSYLDPGLSVLFNDQTRDFALDAPIYVGILGPYVFTQDPAAPAGTFLYSPTNYLILGAKLESVTGSSLQDLLNTYVLNPAGLNDIVVYQSDQNANGDPVIPDNTTAFFFRFTVSGIQQVNPILSVMSSGGASGRLVATPTAMVQYLDALFSEEILSQASLNLLTDFQPINGRLSNAYGMGTERFTFTINGQEKTFIGHYGDMHHTAMLLYQPDERVGLFISNNARDSANSQNPNILNINLMNDLVESMLNIQANTTHIADQAAPTLPLFLFPNPTTDRLTLRYEVPFHDPNARLTLHDLTGRVVHTQLLPAGTGPQALSLSVADLPVGLYTLRVAHRAGTAARKVLVE